ncbi:MAG: tetratricopeptide repeat protein, partial [Bacteroidales bacterium]
GAATRYRDLATELFGRGREQEAIDALAEAVGLVPDDDDARELLVRAHLKAGDIARARNHATAAAHFAAIADALEASGQDDAACDTLAEAVSRHPQHVDLRARLVRRLIARNELDQAAAVLPAELVGEEGDLLLALAEVHLRLGRFDPAREVLQALATRGAGDSQNLVLLGCSLADVNADAAFQCIDVATDAAVALSDWPAAAAALQEFVRRVPGYIPALIRLVDVCVDGSLDAALYAAQCDLADCYLAAGRAAEARVIAEDLTLRSPADSASRARFRRALEMLGESDPDAVINDRLSAHVSLESVGLPPLPPPVPTSVAAPPVDPRPVASAVARPEIVPDKRPVAEAPQAAGNPRPPSNQLSAAATRPEVVEIDLSGALSSLKTPAAAGNGGEPAPGPAKDAAELGDIFREFRAEVAREQATSSAAEHYKLALTYCDMGMLDESARSLETAVRSPRYRFQAASLLGRIHRERGRLPEAIEWFERAAETPAASPDAARALLYELGRALEDAHESSRALAVYLELRADAGSYRDVSSRIEQLARLNAGD